MIEKHTTCNICKERGHQKRGKLYTRKRYFECFFLLALIALILLWFQINLNFKNQLLDTPSTKKHVANHQERPPIFKRIELKTITKNGYHFSPKMFENIFNKEVRRSVTKKRNILPSVKNSNESLIVYKTKVGYHDNKIGRLLDHINANINQSRSTKDTNLVEFERNAPVGINQNKMLIKYNVVNKNESSGSEDFRKRNASKLSDVELPNTSDEGIEEKAKEHPEVVGKLIAPLEYLAGAIKCIEYKENCSLSCTNGSVSFLDENLGDLQTKCRNIDLNLMVAKCEFNFGTLQQSFFHGLFSLGYFSVDECNLQTIKATAFKHSNVKNLKTLILTNNQLVNFEDTTFDGLTNLVHFEFVQTPLATEFKGKGFLKPLAENLNEAFIQPMTNASQVMDPLIWWQGLELTSLTKLDIGNTNFNGVLNPNTFKSFVNVEYLILLNCNLLSVKAEVFDFLSNSLKYLDLRLNYLKTLDYKFLEIATLPSLEINLGLNEWHCDCDSEMLIYYIQHDVKLSEEILCTTPEQYQQLEITRVLEECKGSETTIILTSTSPGSVTSTTNITSPISTSSTTETTTTTTSPTDTTEKTSSSSAISTDYTTTTTENIWSTLPPFVPPELISIECYMDEQKTESSWRYILQPKANFFLYNNSSTSITVSVELNDVFEKSSLIYFTNYSDYKNALATANSKSQMIFYIIDLKPSTAYIFCLIVESALAVSPFDCRSSLMQREEIKTTWLLKTDKAWFIATITIISCLLFLASLTMVFIFLRSNPRWLLKRNDRLLRVYNSTKKVLLISKKSSYITKSSSLNPSPLSQRSSKYLSSLPPLLNCSDNNLNVVYTTRHGVPITRAPISPPGAKASRNSPRSRCRPSVKVCSQTMDYLDIIENDPDYQTIDYYEAIYFK